MRPLIEQLMFQESDDPFGRSEISPDCDELHSGSKYARRVSFQYVQYLGALLEKQIPHSEEGLRLLAFDAMPVHVGPSNLIKDGDDALTLLMLLAPERSYAQALYTAGSMDLVAQLVGTPKVSSAAWSYGRRNPFIRLGVGLRAAERVGAELKRLLTNNTHPGALGYVTPGLLSAFLGDLCVVGAMAALLITSTTELMLAQSPPTSAAGLTLEIHWLHDRFCRALACLARLWVVTRATQLSYSCDIETHKRIISPETATTFDGGEVRQQLLRDLDACGVPHGSSGDCVFENSGMWRSWRVYVGYRDLARLSAWGHRFGRQFLEDNNPETWWAEPLRPPVLMPSPKPSTPDSLAHEA